MKKSISPKLVMLHRIGQPDLPINVFHHPHFEPDDSTFSNYLNLGNKSLDLFSREYCNQRFFALLPQYKLKIPEVYTCNHNLSIIGINSNFHFYCLAREFGMEYALMDFSGIPKIHPLKLPPLKADLILSDCFKSILGAIMTNKGPQACRDFLDTFLYSSTRFNIKRFFNPKHPKLILSRWLLKHSKDPLQFRLLHESGRMSNDSMFVVGAFSGNSLLSQGYGPSILLAEHRAALEYLWKTCLEEKDMPYKRPSDQLLSSSSLSSFSSTIIINNSNNNSDINDDNVKKNKNPSLDPIEFLEKLSGMI